MGHDPNSDASIAGYSQEEAPPEGRQYRILGVIGRGGFGTVYHARMEGPEGFVKDVAIKLLHDTNPAPDVLARFRDEARILGRMRDRATVSVDPPVRLGGRWAVVMDLVDGVDCRRLLREYGRFPPRVALEIVEEVARTLHNLYEHPDESGHPMRLLHRDIKPSNIQIAPTGALKVLDFGVARASFANRESETMSQIAGTLGYIAPERVDGIEDTCGDIYGLGIVLEELATGRRPSRPGEETGLRSAGTPVPPEVMALATEMHASDPRQRPSATEVERRCAELARRIPGPTLREWARDHAFAQPRLPPDEIVGAVLTEPVTGLPPYPTPTGTSALPRGVSRGTVLALMASGVLAALSVAIWGALTVLAALWYARQPPRVEPPPPTPTEVAAPEAAPSPPVVAPIPEPVFNPPLDRPLATPQDQVRPANKPPAPRTERKPPAVRTARISAEGANVVQFIDASGSAHPAGTLLPGTYQIRAQFGNAAPVPAGTVTLTAGQEVKIRCDARFQRCLPH